MSSMTGMDLKTTIMTNLVIVKAKHDMDPMQSVRVDTVQPMLQMVQDKGPNKDLIMMMGWPIRPKTNNCSKIMVTS